MIWSYDFLSAYGYEKKRMTSSRNKEFIKIVLVVLLNYSREISVRYVAEALKYAGRVKYYRVELKTDNPPPKTEGICFRRKKQKKLRTPKEVAFAGNKLKDCGRLVSSFV